MTGNRNRGTDNVRSYQDSSIHLRDNNMPISSRLSAFRTAVLYQASPPPAINGVTKPAKPGGKSWTITTGIFTFS